LIRDGFVLRGFRAVALGVDEARGFSKRDVFENFASIATGLGHPSVTTELITLSNTLRRVADAQRGARTEGRDAD
jgi:hypothetical protein